MIISPYLISTTLSCGAVMTHVQLVLWKYSLGWTGELISVSSLIAPPHWWRTKLALNPLRTIELSVMKSICMGPRVLRLGGVSRPQNVPGKLRMEINLRYSCQQPFVEWWLFPHLWLCCSQLRLPGSCHTNSHELKDRLKDKIISIQHHHYKLSNPPLSSSYGSWKLSMTKSLGGESMTYLHLRLFLYWSG